MKWRISQATHLPTTLSIIRLKRSTRPADYFTSHWQQWSHSFKRRFKSTLSCKFHCIFVCSQPRLRLHSLQRHLEHLREEGPEVVKWELAFALLQARKWDFVHWDWDLRNKHNRKMGMGFQFQSNTGLDCGIWAGIKNKTICWEMGLGPPPPTLPPSRTLREWCPSEKHKWYKASIQAYLYRRIRFGVISECLERFKSD